MGKRVLVVDDEKLIVKGIRFSLEQDGMEVDCAYDGEEALKCAREKEYDMILLDIMLPKLDGMDYSGKLTEIIRDNSIRSVTVVRMEVPCCGGLEQAVRRALAARGKQIPCQVVTLSLDGGILPQS